MDIPLRTKIHHVLVDHPEAESSIVRTFAAKPALNLEKQFGRLFGLVEISAYHPTVEAFIDFLVDQLKTHYYQTSQTSENYDLERAFETALQKTNVAIATFLETESVALKIDDINIVAGVIIEQELVFTQVGATDIFLLQYLRPAEYRMIDILEATNTPRYTPNPLKIFSQVITGRIKPKDIVLLATDNVFDYFSIERIRTTIGEATTDRKTALRALFQGLTNKENFGLLTIELEKISSAPVIETDLKKIDYVKAASKDSMRELIQTEQNTQKLLTPSILPELKKYTQIFSQALANYLQKVKTDSLARVKTVHRPKINLPTIKTPSIKATHLSRAGNTLSTTITAGLKTVSPTVQPIKKQIAVLFRRIARLPVWKYLSTLVTTGALAVKTFYRSLPRRSQRLFLLIVLLILVFSQSIIWISFNNAHKARLERFMTALTDAESKKNESLASLIYRDENLARLRLIEAKNLLTSAEPTTAAQRQQVATLAQEIEAELQKLRYLEEVTDIVQVVNFQNLDSLATMAPLLVDVGQTVYGQNQSNQSLYQADLTTRTLSGTLLANVTTGNFVSALAINNQEILFFNQTGNLFRFNPANTSATPLTINIASGVKPTAISIFNNRLYIIDQANNQIYRYDKTANGYGNANNWVTDERIDLHDAVDLVVDGTVYVLKQNGQILKLEAGELLDFTVAVLDPPLSKPTKLKTTPDSRFLYILDPASKRLVVFNKDGQLVRQYTSEQFNDLKDFVVKEAEKKIYVLNGNTVLGFAASHLQ